MFFNLEKTARSYGDVVGDTVKYGISQTAKGATKVTDMVTNAYNTTVEATEDAYHTTIDTAGHAKSKTLSTSTKIIEGVADASSYVTDSLKKLVKENDN